MISQTRTQQLKTIGRSTTNFLEGVAAGLIAEPMDQMFFSTSYAAQTPTEYKGYRAGKGLLVSMVAGLALGVGRLIYEVSTQ